MKEVPGHVGWEGKVQLKEGAGCCGACPFEEGRAPFKKGAPLGGRARPYCLLDRQGAQAPPGGLVISSFSFMQLRVDEN